MNLRAPQSVAPSVVFERRAVVLLILEALAQGEMEVIAIFGLKITARQLRLHQPQVVGAEAEGLEIGETPPRFSEARINRQRAAVGADPIARVTGGLERMTITQPEFRL